MKGQCRERPQGESAGMESLDGVGVDRILKIRGGSREIAGSDSKHVVAVQCDVGTAGR